MNRATYTLLVSISLLTLFGSLSADEKKSDATLDETFDFIIKKINTHGSYNITSKTSERSYDYKIDKFNLSKNTLYIQETVNVTNPHNFIEVLASGRTFQELITLDLKQLDPDAVDLTELNPGAMIRLQSTDMEESIRYKSRSAGGYKDITKVGFDEPEYKSSVSIYLDDASIATRVAKALTHAIKSSGGKISKKKVEKPEPF
jgi:hypothetical protein